MSRTHRNIIANYIGRAWGALALYLFTPFYLNILGPEPFGLVGFYTIMLGVLAFTDLGLTATLGRETARLASRPGESQGMQDLVRTIEFIYLSISTVLAASVFLLSDTIATRWLNFEHLDQESVTRCVALMGAALAIQLPANMYQGGLLGLQRQVAVNVIHITTGTVRGLGALIVLLWVSPTAEAFFWWQIATNTFQLLATRFCLISFLPAAQHGARFQVDTVKRIWPYATGVTGISIISMVLLQADKLLVSKLVSLEGVGYYGLAASLAQVPALMSGPISSALFPRFTEHHTRGDTTALTTLYHRACQLTAVFIFPASLTLAFFSYEAIALWTRLEPTAQQAWPVASALILGAMFMAAQVIPHSLALASGWTQLNIRTGLASILFFVPALLVMAQWLGAIGAALTWLLLNLVTLPIYTFFLHRQLLPGQTAKWWIEDFLRPMLPALVCVVTARLLVAPSSDVWISGVTIGLTATVAFLLSVFATGEVRKQLFAIWNRWTTKTHFSRHPSYGNRQ